MIRSPLHDPSPSGPATSGPPRLVDGARMDQKTFHALYEATPPGFKAELIEGVVVVPSPLSTEHGFQHVDIIGWIYLYRAATPGTRAGDNMTMILGPKSEPQPDVALIVEPESGGQTHREGRYLAGPPELIIEVALSSKDHDLKGKYRDYERAGVREYLVYLLEPPDVRWFVRRGDRFELLEPGADGLFRSEVFPGLWLDPAALIRGDLAAVRAALQAGLGSPEHAAFVAQLQARRGG